MGFYDVLDQVLELLRQRGRVTYRVLKREFNLDDEALEDLKEGLFFAHPVVDQEGRGLVWTGEPGQPESTSTPTQSAPLEVTQQAQPSQVERPITEPHTPDAERRHLTVVFTDLVESTGPLWWQAVQVHATHAPWHLGARRHLCVTSCQDFLLSLVDHGRYTYARTAWPIPTLSSAHRIGLGRVGDDL